MDPELTMMEAEESISKAVEYAVHEFAAVRTGKASPALVEGLDVHVTSYGSHMKLKQLAMITTPDSRLIRIEPFDSATLKDIDRAIRESRLGLNGSLPSLKKDVSRWSSSFAKWEKKPRSVCARLAVTPSRPSKKARKKASSPKTIFTASKKKFKTSPIRVSPRSISTSPPRKKKCSPFNSVPLHVFPLP
jgi:hypothetical protein